MSTVKHLTISRPLREKCLHAYKERLAEKERHEQARKLEAERRNREDLGQALSCFLSQTIPTPDTDTVETVDGLAFGYHGDVGLFLHGTCDICGVGIMIPTTSRWQLGELFADRDAGMRWLCHSGCDYEEGTTELKRQHYKTDPNRPAPQPVLPPPADRATCSLCMGSGKRWDATLAGREQEGICPECNGMGWLVHVTNKPAPTLRPVGKTTLPPELLRELDTMEDSPGLLKQAATMMATGPSGLAAEIAKGEALAKRAHAAALDIKQKVRDFEEQTGPSRLGPYASPSQVVREKQLILWLAVQQIRYDTPWSLDNIAELWRDLAGAWELGHLTVTMDTGVIHLDGKLLNAANALNLLTAKRTDQP